MYVCKKFILTTIFVVALNLFGIVLRCWEFADFFLFFDYTIEESSTVYDYIIVGCGSAGAVLARRLAEDKNVSVLILEAGRHSNKILDIPSMGLLLQKSSFDWQYTTIPQSSSCFALTNHESRWPRGKIVGGTSMLNNMVYVRGHPEDFKNWYKDKNNFNYTSDILPYFEKLENNTNGDDQNSVYVSDLAFTTLLPNLMLDAAKSVGFFISEDTTNCQKGFGLPKATILNGQRFTSAHKLVNSNKPNIFLGTNRVVEKVLLHNNYEAHGVKYRYLGESYYAKASKGVILSAGVIGTPKILLHSGIGPKKHLEELNMTSKINLPVGENLLDHVTTGINLILLNQSLGIGLEQMLSPFSVLDYIWNGQGVLTTGGCEVLAYINTETVQQSNDVQPDLQFMVMTASISEDDGVRIRHLFGISDYTWNNYFALSNQTFAMSILPILLHPKSRGTVRLKDKNFESNPIIDPRYLTDKKDVKVLLKGIEIIKKLITTDSMQKLGARLNTNHFPGCESFKFDSQDYWECYVRHVTLTSYHPAGTCKMGHDGDPSAVVNYDFEVKGTNNLFVVDASVMPTLTSGNINGAVLMLAEMASDIIKFRKHSSRGKCDLKNSFKNL